MKPSHKRVKQFLPVWIAASFGGALAGGVVQGEIIFALIAGLLVSLLGVGAVMAWSHLDKNDN